MSFRIIQGPDDLAEGASWLASADPRLAGPIAACGPLPLRREPDGFETLVRAIVSQQVSTASAGAILGRLREAGLDKADAIRAASDEELRAPGLSRSKVRYLRALSEAELDFDALRHAPDEEVVKTLTELPGIGRWTAEIYLLFALGRADAFAPGDLALQESARMMLDLPQRPREAELRRIAEGWAPWRGVAARLLWAWFRLQKNRSGTLWDKN